MTASRWLKILILTLLPFSAFANDHLTYVRTAYRHIPGWQMDQQQNALLALKGSCPTLMRKNGDYKQICTDVLNQDTISPAQARSMIEKHFNAYLVVNDGNDIGLFTGYYEPQMKGSLTKTQTYGVPLYGKPKGLVKVDLGIFDKKLRGRKSFRILENGRYTRLPSRQQISDGPLLKNTPVLAWVHSKIDRFFLQIQGSGSVLLPNGKRLLLGYAGQNGWAYYAIGRYLIQIGALTTKTVSMQSIKDWLYNHPTEAETVMNKNPSFVFFRKLKTQSPPGAHGVPLTAYRSLAVDPRFTKLGSLLFLSTYLPIKAGGNITEGAKFQRLMVAQDTGGAIKGPIRGDVFFGSGDYAEWLAGHMQSKGRLWLLRPKS